MALAAGGVAAQERPLPVRVQVFPSGDLVDATRLETASRMALEASLPAVDLDDDDAPLTLGVGATCVESDALWVCSLRSSLVMPHAWLGPFGTVGRVELWSGGGVAFGFDRDGADEQLRALIQEQVATLGAVWDSLAPEARGCWTAAIADGELAEAAAAYRCNPDAEPRRRSRGRQRAPARSNH